MCRDLVCVIAHVNLGVLARYTPGDTSPTILTMFPTVTASYNSNHFRNCFHATCFSVHIMSINVGAKSPFRKTSDTYKSYWHNTNVANIYTRTTHRPEIGDRGGGSATLQQLCVCVVHLISIFLEEYGGMCSNPASGTMVRGRMQSRYHSGNRKSRQCRVVNLDVGLEPIAHAFAKAKKMNTSRQMNVHSILCDKLEFYLFG